MLRKILNPKVPICRKEGQLEEKASVFSPLLTRLGSYLREGKMVGLVYVVFSGRRPLGQFDGESLLPGFSARCEAIILEVTREVIGPQEVVAVTSIGEMEYCLLVVIPESMKERMAADLLVWRDRVTEETDSLFYHFFAQEVDVRAGFAYLPAIPQDLAVDLYRALLQAREMASRQDGLHEVLRAGEFRLLLQNGALQVVYQPVINLRDGSIMGWEALARGPESSYFQNPLRIFAFAEKAGLLFTVERLCRRLAVSRLGELEPGQKLFLNIHPRTVCDPSFVPGETVKMLRQAGLTPRHVVFEVTERHFVDDYAAFNKTLSHYRGQGFLVAVDDMGAGFSSLQAVAEIKPEFIKVDMSIVRDVHLHPTRRALVEALVGLAEKTGSLLIAEGIESEGELEALVKLGVHCGQGYFFGRPTYPKRGLEEAAEKKLQALISRAHGISLRRNYSIGDFVTKAVTVAPETRIREVKRIFDQNEALEGVVLVREGEQPYGLITRRNLEKCLSSQYGAALYFDRPAETLMDPSPLVVEESVPLEAVAQAAMGRVPDKLYDLVVVVREGRLLGVVSVQAILDVLARIKLEIARGANPLTGLPGNRAIESELQKLAAAGWPWEIVYVDLDNFKAFNDKYGFDRGDQVILFTARLLSSVLRKYGGEYFLGHIGGDDFLFALAPAYTAQVCEKFIRYFDRLIGRFYDAKDRAEGGIWGCDRRGEWHKFPFITVSLAVLGKENLECCADLRFVAEKAAQLKKYAKSVPQSIWVRDRRKCG